MATDQALNSADGKSATLFTGSCFCKAISFTLSALPQKSYICHCLDCRRFSGSSFAHNAVFPHSALGLSFTAPTEASTASPPSEKHAEQAYAQGASAESNADRVAVPHNTEREGGRKCLLSTFGDEQGGVQKFCSVCGTRLLLYCGKDNVDMRDMVIVPIGAIDGSHDDERLKPLAEGWCKRRESWMAGMEGTETFEEW